MIQWLVTNWHWLELAGILLSIIGLFYTAYGSLGDRFNIFQSLTQSFTFGVLGGLIGSLGTEFILFIVFTTVWAISGKNLFSSPYIYSLLSVASSIFFSGLAIGVMAGFLIVCWLLGPSVQKAGRFQQHIFSNLTSLWLYWLLRTSVRRFAASSSLLTTIVAT